ncbi:hypothetical protein C6P42_003825 [Pichia californica]|nr:hypothetical protein C6P42_003825 [[Candida] californica]
MNFQIIFLLLLNSLSISKAYPYEGFPFQEQLPDIARIGENYEFIINSQTFKSDDSSNNLISYNAYNLPNWLNFDSNLLKFYGLPTNNDSIGEINFLLQGTDSQGSLNQSCTIYLSDQPSPELNDNNSIIKQLSSMGSTNGYNGIVINPSSSFNFKFDSNTFQIPSSSDNSIVAYYGKSSNRTSLPSWCFFDSNSLTFYGTSPAITSENAPSLQYDLTLIATDYSGYSAIYSDFKIVVGGHNLYLNSTYNNTLSVNPNESFSIDLPLNNIYLDNSKIQSNQINNVIIYNGPNWVEIDNNNSILSGLVPNDQTSNIVVNVTLYDIYGDSVYMNFDIDVIHEIFNVDSLNNITVTDNTFFEYTLPSSYFKNESATDIIAYFDDSWLTYYHSNKTFVGKVPNNFDLTSIELDASINSLSESKTFYIIGKSISSSSRYSSSTRVSSSRISSSRISSYLPSSSSYGSSSAKFSIAPTSSSTSLVSSASSSISTTSSTSASASSSTVAIVTNKSTDSNNKKSLAIGLGVAIPLAFIIIASIIFFFCCCGKRRKNKSEEEGNNNNNNNNNDIPPNNSSPYIMKKQNSSNTTITSARILAEKNLTNLEKDSEQSSYYSAAQDTLTSESNHNLYEAANMQMSTDRLIDDISNYNKSNTNSGIFNSWRKSSTATTTNFKPRDSLSSLATVATNDLLTVNMINENKIRQSQMIYPKFSKLQFQTNSSDSLFNSNISSTSDFAQISPNNYNYYNNNNNNNTLTSLREENYNNISRDGSSHSISSEAQLVGFKNSGSVSRKIQREEKSYKGELYNIGDDDNSYESGSN